MPGYDGTGPQGQGPLTGGGRGYCASGTQPTSGLPAQPSQDVQPVQPSTYGVGRGGAPRGGGRGRCFGGGRGFGMRGGLESK